MLAEDRRRLIVEMTQERGSIRVSELSDMFGVNETTIRRDLSDLVAHGVLRRAHGGAVSAVGNGIADSGVRSESEFSARLLDAGAEKAAIGREAAKLVVEGSTIIIDSGTTAAYLAHELRDRKDLAVVTNAVTTAMELIDNPGITLVMTGGVLRRQSLGAAGELSALTLREIRVDHAFVATHSVSIDAGLTYPSFDEVVGKRAMIEAASEVTLLADHSKFGRHSLVRVAPLTAVDRVITSAGIDEATVASIRDLGVEVVVAETDAETLPLPGPFNNRTGVESRACEDPSHLV